MKRLTPLLALTLVLTVSLAQEAMAVTTWDLTGAGGNLGATEPFTSTSGGSTLNAAGLVFSAAFPFTVAAGDPLDLHQNALGLGIIGVDTAVPMLGGFDACVVLQLECNTSELIRLKFGSANWDPVSVMLTNLTAGDNWTIWGDNDGSAFNGATLLAAGLGSPGSLTVLLDGNTPFEYLYVRRLVPGDCTTSVNCALLGTPSFAMNEDFRISQVVGQLPGQEPQEPEDVVAPLTVPQQAQVPEPATPLLLLAGLVALRSAFARRGR